VSTSVQTDVILYWNRSSLGRISSFLRDVIFCPSVATAFVIVWKSFSLEEDLFFSFRDVVLGSTGMSVVTGNRSSLGGGSLLFLRDVIPSGQGIVIDWTIVRLRRDSFSFDDCHIGAMFVMVLERTFREEDPFFLLDIVTIGGMHCLQLETFFVPYK